MPDDRTVRDAIEKSGIQKMSSTIDPGARKVGVFGRLVKLDSALKPGDPDQGSRRVAMRFIRDPASP